MRYLIVIACLLCGCQKKLELEVDRSRRGEIRHEYFVECMKLLPAGPQQTKYNDWDDVVDACTNAAWYMANGACENGCPAKPAIGVE